MPLRIVEIAAPDTVHSAIRKIADEHNAIDSWHSAKNKDGRRTTRILVHLEQQQEMMDALQKAMFKEDNWRLIVLPVEATIPKQEEPEKDENGSKLDGSTGTIARETIYNQVEKGIQADANYFLLVILSTLVCSIGLVKDNVSVVIGAMVIAPLLGPNLALAFGAALGDRGLMFQSIKTNMAGMGLTLAIAFAIGAIMNVPLASSELMARTEIGYEVLALALAAGAAGVLSLTTGLSGTLVGVMVAVALMPPAITMGLMMGGNHWEYAYSAGLLLTANIVCVSIAAQLVFLWKGIKPRTWYMRKKSKQSVRTNLIFWGVMLLTLIGLIALQQGG